MRVTIGFFIAIFLVLTGCTSKEHSSIEDEKFLLLSRNGAKDIYENIGNELVSKSFNRSKAIVDKALLNKIEVPLPVDAGGGYTHEKHKSNYVIAREAGALFLITGESKYLDLVKTMLLEYAELYPTLELHPQQKNQGPGKLFWQILNEEVALVYFIQAFDAIKSELSEEEFKVIKEGLIEPMVSFIKDDSRETFTKIHNHALWGVAGVGMAGIALENEEWLLSSLYGPEKDSTCGYFKMLSSLFSPDGYYSEGPYYQRYALMPVVVLAQALEQNRKEFGIIQYRDSLVIKAVRTTFDLSTCQGAFFPLNDAVKAKAITTPELGYAIPFVYNFGGRQTHWIDAMQQNGNLVLTDAISELSTKKTHYKRTSQFISDGPDGNHGGLSIFRSRGDCTGITSLMKFGTHGMGHGHFDQLGIQVYVHGQSFLSDYGASRFHNIPQKEGGRYLKENNTWANQTIAHNTAVLNRTTQHEGSDKLADQSQSYLVQKSFTDRMSYTVAVDSNAYPGNILTRYHVMLNHQGKDLIIDLQQVESSSPFDVDFPFYFENPFVESAPQIDFRLKNIEALGESNGYQYLWDLGHSEPDNQSQFTWQIDNTFLTLHQSSLVPYSVHIVRTGANDPNHNLLSKEGIILRSERVKKQAVCSVFELHGSYDTVNEFTSGAESKLGKVEIIEFKDFYTIVIGDQLDLKLYKTTLAESSDLVVKT